MDENDAVLAKITAISNGYADRRMFGKTKRYMKFLKTLKKHIHTRDGYMAGVVQAARDLNEEGFLVNNK